MDQENSEMHSEDTSCSPTAMSRTSFTDLVGDSIKKEENSLPECKIKLEIVEELINDNIATSDPENLDTVLDYEVSQSKEHCLIKQEVFDSPEKHSDDKKSFNIEIVCKKEPTDFSEFICNLCKETFTCKDSFEEHSRTHSKSMVVEIKMEVFPCETCHRVFSVESELIQHIQAVHHSCGQCGGDFGSREILEAHQLEHRKGAPCPKKPKLEYMQPTTAEVTSAANSSTATIIDTGADFGHDEGTGVIKKRKKNSKFNIVNTKTTRAVKKPSKCIKTKTVSATSKILTCDICDYTTVYVKYLNSHLRAHASKDTLYSCDFCPYLTVRSTSYETHIMRHTGEKPFSCHVCKKNFIKKSNLTTHFLIHTGERPFSCNECEKKFVHKSHLKRHQLSAHPDETRLSCDVCNKEFNQKRELKAHMLTHTGEKPFSCDAQSLEKQKEFIESKFNEKSILKTILLKPTGELPFSCYVCEKKFSQKGHLKDHILTHTGEKPFPCDVCEKKFARNGHLKAHKLTHNIDERPFSCGVCGKKFAQNGHLKDHMLIHTGERPFRCDECEKTFSKKYDLKRHQLTHTSEKPYICNLCDMKFSIKWRLERHVRTHTTQP